MNIGILGLGEVGSAIKQLVDTKHQTFVRELDYDHIKDQSIDILHVCIPYTPKFVDLVSEAIKDIKPQLAIVSSTVKPGTTQQIHQNTGVNMAHTPFMGVHPIKPDGQFRHPSDSAAELRLFDYFSKFPKVIGPVNEESYRLANDHFQGLGLKTVRFDSPLNSELAKILSTTYYGWNIIFEKWVYSLCQDNQANFDQVYTQYNTYYNQGYANDLPHVTRPVLSHHQGEIGGHCVIPNAKILDDWLSDAFTDFLLEQNRKLGSDH